jgi:hypothetical protein
MTKTSQNEARFAGTINKRIRARDRRPFSTGLFPFSAVSLTDLAENERLKKFLKRAVSTEQAPEYLIDSIKKAIRRG